MKYRNLLKVFGDAIPLFLGLALAERIGVVIEWAHLTGNEMVIGASDCWKILALASILWLSLVSISSLLYLVSWLAVKIWDAFKRHSNKDTPTPGA